MVSRVTAGHRARRGRPSRAEQVEIRRRALLDAAGTVFRSDGYLAASVDAIADAAGFTKGAVYSQFASKADLFLTLLEERIEQRRAANAAAVSRARDSETAMEFLREASELGRDDPQWRLALIEFRIVAARDPELNERYKRAHAVAAEGIAAMFTVMYERLGLTPPVPVEALARTFLGMEAGGLLEEIVAGHPVREDVARAVAARILGFPDPPTVTR